MMPLTTAETPHIDRQRCKGCGLCVEFCPFGRLLLDSELNQAGYHPAIVADPPASDDAPPAAGRADTEGLPGAGDRRPAHLATHVGERLDDGSLAHNVAFWCVRCRYCELVCPDAAVRVPGPVEGLEGAGGGDWA